MRGVRRTRGRDTVTNSGSGGPRTRSKGAKFVNSRRSVTSRSRKQSETSDCISNSSSCTCPLATPPPRNFGFYSSTYGKSLVAPHPLSGYTTCPSHGLKWTRLVEWLQPTHDYFLTLLDGEPPPTSPSVGSGSAGPETAGGTNNAAPPVDTEQPGSTGSEGAADLLDRRSTVGHLAGAVCSHCNGPGRCFLCDFEAGVCNYCKGTGVYLGEEPDVE